jgi:hypothetical protein
VVEVLTWCEKLKRCVEELNVGFAKRCGRQLRKLVPVGLTESSSAIVGARTTSIGISAHHVNVVYSELFAFSALFAT